jgi:hypothetical protein
VLSLQAVAVLDVAALQHQRTRLFGAAQGRSLRPRPSSACIVTNSRGCSNSPCSAEILQTNNNLPYPPDDTYVSPRHQKRRAERMAGCFPRRLSTARLETWSAVRASARGLLFLYLGSNDAYGKTTFHLLISLRATSLFI